MSELAVIALDVGGTTLDAACVGAGGELIGGLREGASPAARSKDEIVDELARAINGARARTGAADAGAPGASGAGAGPVKVVGCGIAMPAPFDYAAGVSYMEHKFQAVYGVDLGGLLRERTGLPVCFVNDADAFGLGVGWRQLPDVRRFAALTIGTGLGGSFIADGRAVQSGDGVPPGGEVWQLPFGDSILEDHVSARAVVTSYAGLRPAERRSAREIADLARQGDQAAFGAYRALGAALGAGLAPVLRQFAPETVVIGGKVGMSLELFRPALVQALAAGGLPDLPVIQAAPGNLAIWGAARRPLAAGRAANS